MALRTAEMDCRLDSLAPRQARAFVASFMKACGLAELVDRAELLTSEVVTNALAHAHSPIRLVVEAHSSSVVGEDDSLSVVGEGHPSSVVVEIKDTAPTAVVIEGDEIADADRGRGMVLVEALSDRWGWWTEEDGKVVWFALLAA
jgi:anti-sigma regulatory factor (Ser/Thr protein kinase)